MRAQRLGISGNLALAIIGCLLVLAASGGCSRRFFRKWADTEVYEVLAEKDRIPAAKIYHFHVYPDSRARFADPTNPDRPPMPPDDPVVSRLAPNPQKPGKAGISRVEGTGYLDILANWDAENRALGLGGHGMRVGQERKGYTSEESKFRSTFAHTKGCSHTGISAHAETRGCTRIGTRDGTFAEIAQAKGAALGEAPPEIAQVKGAPFDDPPPLGQLEDVQHEEVQHEEVQPPEVQPPEVQPDSGGFLLRLDQAVELGVFNSREFQTRREDLYLSALPVTQERFGFAFQFLAVQDAIREWAGADSVIGKSNAWRLNSTAGLAKLFPRGALLLFSWANQTVFDLTGNLPRHTVSTSTLNLDIVQPFLRGGGKAVTLEPLTQVERNLVYEIRDYARFRKLFYQYISAGGDLSNSLFGGSGLGQGGVIPGTSDLGTGNPVRLPLLPSSSGRLNLGSGLQAPSEGFLPNLFRLAQVRNEQKNVDRLQDYLRFFQGYQEGGEVSSLQVGQVKLDLLSGRNTVLQRERDLRDGLERFKQQLGLPVDVPLELETGPIQPITKQLQGFESAIDHFEEVLKSLNAFNKIEEAGKLRARLRQLLRESRFAQGTPVFQKSLEKRWRAWEDLKDLPLEEELARLRVQRQKLLDLRFELEKKNRPLAPIQIQRLEEIEREIALGDLEGNLRKYEAAPWKEAKAEDRRAVHAALFRDVRRSFELLLEEARAERLDLVRRQWPALPPLIVESRDLLTEDPEEAHELVTRLALENRLDVLNARAQVVDAWRQVAVFANSLLGTFNLGYHLDSITPPGEARPLAFSSSRSRQQLFLSTEVPLVRLTERNAYRASLIALQRARRALMAVEDAVAAQVRAELRQLRDLAENYTIQQQSVELAYSQVQSALETFRAPPDPRQARGGNFGTAAALTQQLLNAQRGLPQAQNSLFNIWITYQIVRQQLYLDLELFPLDNRGIWIDEFAAIPGIP